MRDAPVNDPGFVGIASELAEFDSKYEQIFLNLLGRTVVAESLAAAVRMSKASGNRLRIVTLDGQLINAGRLDDRRQQRQGQRHNLPRERA